MFAIVNFGQDPSYEVILGRPFMRQLMILEDWGFDYLYLKHEDVTTHVNLKDRTHTDSTSVKDAQIFQTPSQDLLEESERQIDKLIKIQDYIPAPFSKDDIDPYEWLHTLSTIDVCALPPQTQFCDEYGYEIVPVRVISVANIRTKDFINLKVPFVLHKATS